MSSTDAHPAARTIAGRYHVGARRGSGLEVATFEATDQQTGEAVVLKLVHPTLCEDPEFVQRFTEVMTATADIHHPNLARVLQWGTDQWNGRNVLFVVSEQLGGGSLRDLLDRGRLLSSSQALMVGLEACKGLDALHRAGQLHGDIRPATLVFGDDNRLRVVDPGLSRVVGERIWGDGGQPNQERANYASPERALGEAAEAPSDIYSLALSVLESVTGKLPFTGDSAVSTLANRVDRLLPVNADLGSLATVLERAARPRPDERFTAAGFGAALLQAAQRMPRPAPIPTLSGGLFADRGTAAAEPTGPLTRPDTRRPGDAAPATGGRTAQDAAHDSVDDLAAPAHTTAAHAAAANAAAAHAGDTVEDAAGATAGATANAAAAHTAAANAAAAHAGDTVEDAAGATAGTTAGDAAGAPASPVADVDQAPTGRGPRRRPPAASQPGPPPQGVPAGPLTGPPPPPSAAPVAPSPALSAPSDISTQPGVPAAAAVPPIIGGPPQPVQRTPSASGPTLPPAAPAASPTAVTVAQPARRRFPWWIAAVLLLLAAGGGAGAWYVMSRPEQHVLPKMAGLTEAQARQALEPLGLDLVTTNANDEQVARGAIISSKPAEGVTLTEGDEVAVVISDGPAPRRVPDLIKMTYPAAEQELTTEGLKIARGKDVNDELIPAGAIVSFAVDGQPAVRAGDEVAKGTIIRVVVSSGPKPRQAPRILGATTAVATTTLEQLGLVLDIKSQAFSKAPKGTIISQVPAPGTEVPKGASVSVVVSKGLELVKIPNVAGMNAVQIVNALKAAGLKAGKATGDFTKPLQTMTYNGKTVKIGQLVPKGVAINLNFTPKS